MLEIFKGNFIHTPGKDEFAIHENAYLIVLDGYSIGIFDELLPGYDQMPIVDFGNCLVIPGFCDLHTHAPQYMNTGIGYDEELLTWLEKYTFPLESRYADQDFSRLSYTRFITDLWRNGTTRAAVFATVHLDATRLLFDLFKSAGMGAYVGKVNMDLCLASGLRESTEDSLSSTEEYISTCYDENELVRPIITPRFALATSSKLMTGLGLLAEKYDLPVQTHVSENREEVRRVLQLYPDSTSFSQVYDAHGLLREQKTVLAHGIYLTEKERVLLAKKGIFIAHCPHSNFNMSSGILPVRKLIRKSIPVGLGSDVGGGHRLDMMSAIVGASSASKMNFVSHAKEEALSLPEAFFLATKGSGAFFGNVGSFEAGYETDMLVIDDTNLNFPEERTILERMQRFLYAGDDRNIVKRYVRGKEVPCPFGQELHGS